MIKRNLVSALAILAATTPMAAFAQCAPNKPALAAASVPVIHYKSTVPRPDRDFVVVRERRVVPYVVEHLQDPDRVLQDLSGDRAKRPHRVEVLHLLAHAAVKQFLAWAVEPMIAKQVRKAFARVGV